jgi:hypothetical protein
MIAVRLWGRLGNQLFQYSFGRALSLKRNEDLFFFNPEYVPGGESSPLLNFKIELTYLDANQVKQFYRFAWNRKLFRLERKLLSQYPRINGKVEVENNKDINGIRKNTASCYDGYWHSYEYFSDISDLLRAEIQPKNDIIMPADLVNDITSCESVSIHVRRGDYLSKRNRRIYREIGEEYYRNAISFFMIRKVNPVFYVFSDDIEWVKKNMISLSENNSVFVEHKFPPGDCIDLTLMRMCKHHIIANSTFSWWGAYLGDREGIVICPEKWYVNDKKSLNRGLIPAEWKTM